METRRLSCTQRDLVPGGTPCSVIAALLGLTVLQAAPARPATELIDKRMRVACAVWEALVSARRSTLFADDRMVAVEYVLTNVVDATTLAAPWVYEYELSATHLAAGVALDAAAQQFLAEVARPAANAGVSSVTYVVIPASGGLLALLQHANVVATAARRSYAVTITYQAHTVLVTIVHDDIGTVYSAIDSLLGLWLVVHDDPAPLFAQVANHWCAPARSAALGQVTANMFSLVATPPA